MMPIYSASSLSRTPSDQFPRQTEPFRLQICNSMSQSTSARGLDICSPCEDRYASGQQELIMDSTQPFVQRPLSKSSNRFPWKLSNWANEVVGGRRTGSLLVHAPTVFRNALPQNKILTQLPKRRTSRIAASLQRDSTSATSFPNCTAQLNNARASKCF
jgi:hypothetical protein